jgi:cytochrome c biogenesis protein CcdA/thiol-disulfide isomerase/thioredoxin
VDVAVTLLLAVLAGAGTALSPCVLPVLPVALAAGATGGRRRPFGVAVGLAASFTVAAVLLTRALDALGLPGDLARALAIAVLAAFGLALLVPPLGAALEARLSRLVRARPAAAGGDGFRSGLVLGVSLGLVYAPCAGPILAAVVALGGAVSAEKLAIGFAYGAGAAAALFAVMLGGRRVVRALAPRAGRLQQGLGALMVAVALLLAAGADRDFQAAIADDLPAALVNPTGGLERAAAVDRALGRGRPDLPAGHLPDAGPAPEFAGTGRWFNSRPLSLPKLRGRVVLIDFWTYTCINCLRTLPNLRAWDGRYRAAGLTIVGVHTPEFAFERGAANVADAIRVNRLRYPVVQDNRYGTWNAWRNQYWPAKYLVDARGRVRFWHFGEGGEAETEAAIRSLLAEAGRAPGDALAPERRVERASAGVTTPETYLGWLRVGKFANPKPLRLGFRRFGTARDPLQQDEFAYRGGWTLERERAVAGRDAAVEAQVGARKVFLVLSSPGRARRIRVLVDGRPAPDALAGPDVHGGVAVVRKQRLYRLLDFGRVERRRVTIELERGLAGYAFTFG